MVRLPLPTVRPSCFGKSHADDHVCRPCVFSRECGQECAAWKEVRSLAEMAEVAREEFKADGAVDSEGDYILWGVYCRVHRDVYGRWPHSSTKSRMMPSVIRASKLCDERGYDFPLFVKSQMERAVAMGVTDGCGRKIGFQPNLLLYRRAIDEYAVRANASASMYRSVSAEAFLLSSRGGVLQNTLYRAEMSAGAYYIGCVIAGEKIGFVSAALKTHPPKEWVQCYVGTAPKYLSHLLLYCRLSAAVAVVDRLRGGLSSILGFHPPFAWEPLADVVASLLAKNTNDKLDISWKPGVATASKIGTMGVVKPGDAKYVHSVLR